MKKHLISALAALSLVACVQEQVVTVPQTDAIAFEGAFVDNATRAAVDPSTTTGTIAGFDVWAFMNEHDGTVLVDENVEKAGTGWTYANTQYWTPLNNYYFAALSPMDSKNVTETLATGEAAKLGLGTVDFTNVNGTEDLLYATAYVETPRYEDLKLDNMAPVKFQFNHLLSKVKFTFTNGFKTDNAYVVVKDIKMVAPAAGTIDLAVADYSKGWVLGADDLTLAFGDVEKLAMGKKAECATELLTIPTEADHVYDITFKVELYMGNQLALETEKTSAVTGVAFEMGKAYNLTAEINPDNLDLPSIEFDVVVKNWDEPTIDVAHPVVATLEGEPYTSLQDAIDAVTADATITLVSNVDENVTITQTKDIDLVIDGQGKTFKGTMRVSGQSRYSDTETLTIKNVNFVNYTEEACLDMNWGKSNETRYAHNVTVEGCTFTIDGAGKHVAPAIDMYQPYNVVINDVEVTGAHSLLQVKGGHDGVAVSNVKVTDCKNGIAFGTHDGAVSVTNAEISALGYGIRADGSVATTLTVENATIDALRPIIVRKATGDYNVVLKGANTLTAGDFYQVVFTKGDDEAAYVAPTGNYTLTGADGYKVYPTHANEWVSTAAQFNELLAAKVTEITLAPGKFEGKFTILADGTKITGNPGSVVDCINLNGKDNVTLENIEFDAAGAHLCYDFGGKGKQYANIISGDLLKQNKGSHDLVVDGCTFAGTFANGGAALAFTDQNRKSGASGNITIKNCTFETEGGYYHIYGHYCGDGANGRGNFNIEGNKFNSETLGKPVYLGRYASSTPVVVKGNTFATAASLEDAVYVQDHSNYGVSVSADNNTYGL